MINNRKLVNIRRDRCEVFIGRGSKWGNPYTVVKNSVKGPMECLDRVEAIQKYKQWITEGDGKHLLRDLDELKDKTLGCYCWPLPCHGQVLLRLVELKQKLK